MALVRGYRRSWELAHWYWAQPPPLCPLTLSVQKILTCPQSCIYISLNTDDYIGRLCTQLYKITCIMESFLKKKKDGRAEWAAYTYRRLESSWNRTTTNNRSCVRHRTGPAGKPGRVTTHCWKRAWLKMTFQNMPLIHSTILQLDRMLKEMQANINDH